MAGSDNLKKGKKFSSDYQPENPGRKKSKLKELIEVHDLSSDDISNLIKSMFDKTENELIEIKDDLEKPYLLRSLVTALLKDGKTESLYNINNLLDRAVGKPKETKDVKHSGQVVIIDDL